MLLQVLRPHHIGILQVLLSLDLGGSCSTVERVMGVSCIQNKGKMRIQKLVGGLVGQGHPSEKYGKLGMILIVPFILMGK